MPDKIELSVNVINAVLSYLGTQPYQNVAQLVNAIQREASPQIPSTPVAEESSNEE